MGLSADELNSHRYFYDCHNILVALRTNPIQLRPDYSPAQDEGSYSWVFFAPLLDKSKLICYTISVTAT